ncbi:MAG: tRNA lysidine(34) synthetase TilS [Holophagales bacterium]|nr:tRNA lysidine(34) synthetase TilS [Holophagales bacterium]
MRTLVDSRPPDAPPLRDAFARHLAASGLLDGASALVAACSGGADSTALLALLVREATLRDLPLVAFHVDHQLRGEEGHRDARAAADLATQLGLPFVFRSFPVRDLRVAGESLESAARRLRYESLLALGRDLGPGTLLATGHTLEDQAETVLLHLERRVGRSRGGVRARRSDGVVRPLLPFRREALRDHLRAEGVPWREDASNADERFARNRIRHRVLPALEARWPGATLRLARAAESLTRRLEGIDARVDAAPRFEGHPPRGSMAPRARGRPRPGVGRPAPRPGRRGGRAPSGAGAGGPRPRSPRRWGGVLSRGVRGPPDRRRSPDGPADAPC